MRRTPPWAAPPARCWAARSTARRAPTACTGSTPPAASGSDPLRSALIRFPPAASTITRTIALQPVTYDRWPYPRFVAHRGAGKLAPENTLAAFRLGASHGYRMFECDVKLAADGVPFLMHDSTLDRTTDAATRLPSSASRVAGDHSWGELAQLDAGGWHSRAFAGEPLASLGSIASCCLANGLMLNIEIKPTPGTEREAGEQAARAAARLWQAAPGWGRPPPSPPRLPSFSAPAPEGAPPAAPPLPPGRLRAHPPPDWRPP